MEKEVLSANDNGHAQAQQLQHSAIFDNSASHLSRHTDGGSNDSKPFPSGAIADMMQNEVNHAGHGDATSTNNLAAWVGSMNSLGLINGVAQSLSDKNDARVVRDSAGNVTELNFNNDHEHPVDVKIGPSGDVSINGKDKSKLEADDVAYVKQFRAEMVQKDPQLSAQAKEGVTKLENALMDGDIGAFAEGIKGLKGNEALAEKVTDRVISDMSLVGASWASDGKGGGVMKMTDYGTLDRTDTMINTDGAIGNVALGDNKLFNLGSAADQGFARISADTRVDQSASIEGTHIALEAKSAIKNGEVLTAREMADRAVADRAVASNMKGY